MKLRTVNEEVLYATDSIVVTEQTDMAWLKERSIRTSRRRIRVCAHRDVTDALHEMLIVHEKNTYIRPHKHLNKAESIHIIEGIAHLVVFDETGAITDVLRLGDYGSGRGFFCRISDTRYHTLLIHSDFLLFHETTSGPFDRSETLFAPWSPAETDEPACVAFSRRLQSDSDNFLKSRDETIKN